MNQWPTKDEEGKKNRYKYTSVYLNLSQDQRLIERQTYSFLDLLGDVGGLYDALKLIGGSFIHPIANFTLGVTLLVKNFSMIPIYQQEVTRLKKQSKR